MRIDILKSNFSMFKGEWSLVFDLGLVGYWHDYRDQAYLKLHVSSVKTMEIAYMEE